MTTSDQNIRKASIFSSLSRFLAQTMLFFWGIYFTQVGFSGWEQGILFALYPLLNLLIIVPIGLLNDRIPSRTLIQLGFLMMAFQMWGVSFTSNFWLLIPIFILGDIGGISVYLSLDSLFYKSGDSKKNHQIGAFVGTYLLAAGLGALVGGLILDQIAYEFWFRIIGTLSLLASVSAFILPKTETFYFKIIEYKKDLFQPHILLFMVVMFLWALHFGPEMTSYGLFLKENLHLNYQQMGVYIGTAIMSMYLWARLASTLLNRGVPILRILYVGIFLTAIGAALSTVLHLETSFLGRVIHEAGDAFMMVFLYYGIRQLFAKERAGGVAGLMNFVQMAANMIAILALAPIGKLYGNEYPILITAGFALLALPLAYRFSYLIKH